MLSNSDLGSGLFAWRSGGFVICASAVILLGGTAAEAATGPSKSIRLQEKGVASVNQPTTRPVWLDWRQRPTQQQVDAAYPEGVSGNVYVNIACGRLTHGVLQDCRVKDAAPDTPEIRNMGLALSKSYRAGPNAADMRPETVNWVMLSLNLTDGGFSNAKTLPCLAPFCVEEGLAPPPPPPEPSRTR